MNKDKTEIITSWENIVFKARKEIGQEIINSQNEPYKEDFEDGIIIGLQMALDIIDKLVKEKG